jgi:hypothetical protein
MPTTHEFSREFTKKLSERRGKTQKEEKFLSEKYGKPILVVGNNISSINVTRIRYCL